MIYLNAYFFLQLAYVLAYFTLDRLAKLAQELACYKSFDANVVITHTIL